MEDEINVSDINWEEVVIRQKELQEQASLSPEEADELQQINNYIVALQEDYLEKAGTTEGRCHPGNEIYRNKNIIKTRVEGVVPIVVSTEPNQPAIFIDRELLKGSGSSE